MDNMEDTIKAVRDKSPYSICVSTYARAQPDKGIKESHFRIWPTGDMFETRYIGIGNSEKEAWEDALNNLINR